MLPLSINGGSTGFNPSKILPESANVDIGNLIRPFASPRGYLLEKAPIRFAMYLTSSTEIVRSLVFHLARSVLCNCDRHLFLAAKQTRPRALLRNAMIFTQSRVYTRVAQFNELFICFCHAWEESTRFVLWNQLAIIKLCHVDVILFSFRHTCHLHIYTVSYNFLSLPSIFLTLSFRLYFSLFRISSLLLVLSASHVWTCSRVYTQSQPGTVSSVLFFL